MGGLESPMNKQREALVIAAKYPEVGTVKTRLARQLGHERVCQLYLSFLRDLEEKFERGPRPLFWAYTPPGSSFPLLMRSSHRGFPQEGDDLGQRVLNMFRRLFHDGFQRVVVIGSDSPHIPTEWVDEAFASLSEVDAVFAPADDGGYNLVGLKQTHDLFSDIPMSTPQVLTETLERAHRLGLSVHLLPISFDIDEIEDLEKLRDQLTLDKCSLPHTHEVIRQIYSAGATSLK